MYLSDDKANLVVAAILGRNNGPFSMVDGFLDVETVKVNLVSPRIEIILFKNPVAGFLVQSIHLALMSLPFIAEVLGSTTVTRPVRLLAFTEASRHSITFGMSLSSKILVMRVRLVNGIIVVTLLKGLVSHSRLRLVDLLRRAG